MEIDRGFTEQNILQKCLMLGEEVGELFKAIRKKKKLKLTTIQGLVLLMKSWLMY